MFSFNGSLVYPVLLIACFNSLNADSVPEVYLNPHDHLIPRQHHDIAVVFHSLNSICIDNESTVFATIRYYSEIVAESIAHVDIKQG